MWLELHGLILFLQDGNYSWLTCWHMGMEGWSPQLMPVEGLHMKDKIIFFTSHTVSYKTIHVCGIKWEIGCDGSHTLFCINRESANGLMLSSHAKFECTPSAWLLTFGGCRLSVKSVKMKISHLITGFISNHVFTCLPTWTQWHQREGFTCLNFSQFSPFHQGCLALSGVSHHGY